jgi:hypothetical protein
MPRIHRDIHGRGNTFTVGKGEAAIGRSRMCRWPSGEQMDRAKVFGKGLRLTLSSKLKVFMSPL